MIIIKLKNIYNVKKWIKKEKRENNKLFKYNIINKIIITFTDLKKDFPDLVKLFLNYFFKIIKSVLIIIVIINIDCCLKSLLNNKFYDLYLDICKFINVDYEQILTFILSCTGLAGVLIALFYANFSGIFSSKYINQSKKISDTILNESVNKKYLSFIQEYIIFTLLCSFSISVGINIGHLLILLVVILTVKLIVTFVSLSHRVFGLSNLSTVVFDTSRKILKAIQSVSKDGYKYENINFQIYYRREFYKNYNTIINLLNNCVESKDAETVLTIANSCLYLLSEYSKIKNKIPFDSKWFDEKGTTNNWFVADDHEVIMAVSTGTSLKEKVVTDQFYFEDKLIEMYIKCFNYFIEEKNYDETLNLINSYRDVASELYTITDYEYIKKYNDIIINKLKEIKITDDDNKKSVFAIYDISSLLIIDNVLVSRKLYDSSKQIIEKFLNSSKTYEELLELNSKFLNNKEIYLLVNKLSYERKIEGKLITADWYIKQYILNYFYNRLVEMFNNLNNVYSNMLEYADYYFDKREFGIANIYYSRGLELHNKIQYFMELKNILDGEINKTNDFNYLEFNEEKIINEIETEYIKNLESYGRSANTYALIGKKESFEDNIGHIYYELYDNLLNSIFKNDIALFKRMYPIYLVTCQNGEQLIRKIVNEKSNINYRLNKYSQIKIQFMILNGFVIYYSHLTNNLDWENYIKEKSEILKESDGTITEAERCLLCTDIRKSSFAISIFESNCEIKINNFIRESGLIKYKTVGMFGNKIINNSDELLKKFTFDESMGFYGKLYDIYMIYVVNDYLPKDKKYKSQSKWEDKKYEK